MAELFSTNGQSTLNGAINSSVVTIVVTSAASFPSIAGGSGDTFRIKVDSEIMKVTATSGTTFTVVRGTEGTAAASHSSGATVTEVLTAAALDQLKLDTNIPGKSGNSGQSSLGSTFTLAAATTVYEDTGLSVSLPAAGKYVFIGETRVSGSVSSNDLNVWVKLYNSTTTADASGERPIFFTSAATPSFQLTGTLIALVTTVAAATIKLYAKRTFAGTVTLSQLEGGATGDTTLTWFKLSD